MGGKAALIVVVGFNLVLMIFTGKNNDISQMASTNYVDHYCSEIAHNIALSGANLAANRFFVSPAWEPKNDGLDNTAYNQGTLRVSKEETGHNGRVRIVSTGRYMGIERKVTVVMQATSFGKFALFINSMGAGGGYFPTDTRFDGPVHVNVPLRNGSPDLRQRFRLKGKPTFLGKVTSDVMWQSVDSRDGGGKLSPEQTKKGVENGTLKTQPDFQAGFEDGVHITLPNEFDQALKQAVEVGSYDEHGTQQIGFEFPKDKNISLVFNGDGTISYKAFDHSDTSFNTIGTRIDPTAGSGGGAIDIKYPKKWDKWSDKRKQRWLKKKGYSDGNSGGSGDNGWTTVTYDELVPAGKEFNGALLIRNGNLRVKGTVDERITIAVLDQNNKEAPSINSGTKGYYQNGEWIKFSVDPSKYFGNVWFEDDVYYKDDPYKNPKSDDMLGIISTNYMFAADTPENNTTNLVTHGSYFSLHKGATTENLFQLPNMRFGGNRVDWEYRGGWTEGEAQYTTRGSSQGYDQKYIYDTRLMKDSPPFFPATGALSILSWYEE